MTDEWYETILLGVAAGCVRSVDAESLKYCDGSWVQARPGRISLFVKDTQWYILHKQQSFLVY